MKKQFAIIAIALFAGLLFFSQASAQIMHGQDENKSQNGMMQGMMEQGKCKMMNETGAGFGFYLDQKDKLGMTDAQIAQLRDMKFAYDKANIQRKSALDIAMLELKQAKAVEKIDAGKVEGKIREVHGKQAEIETALFQAQQKAKTVLSDEQRAKVKDMSCPMCGQMHEGGMMGNMMQGMMEKGGMMQQQEQQQDNSAQHEQHHKNK